MREYDLTHIGEAATVIVDGERPPRRPLPTKTQIDAIEDLAALEEIDAEVMRTITKIETDLDFRDGDDDWHARARGALTAHQICRKHLRRRINELRRGKKPPPVIPSEAKLEQARLGAERHQANISGQRLSVAKRAAQAIHATALGNAFLGVALRSLPRDQFATILEKATTIVEDAARKMLADAMPPSTTAPVADEGKPVRSEAQPNEPVPNPLPTLRE